MEEKKEKADLSQDYERPRRFASVGIVERLTLIPKSPREHRAARTRVPTSSSFFFWGISGRYDPDSFTRQQGGGGETSGAEHKSSREKSTRDGRQRRRNECCHQETRLKASCGVLVMGPFLPSRQFSFKNLFFCIIYGRRLARSQTSRRMMLP